MEQSIQSLAADLKVQATNIAPKPLHTALQIKMRCGQADTKHAGYVHADTVAWEDLAFDSSHNTEAACKAKPSAIAAKQVLW